MEMKEVLENVRGDLRARPDSHFSDIYMRLIDRKVKSSDINTALYEMLERDEVRIKEGKWRLAAQVERRRA